MKSQLLKYEYIKTSDPYVAASKDILCRSMFNDKTWKNLFHIESYVVSCKFQCLINLPMPGKSWTNWWWKIYFPHAVGNTKASERASRAEKRLLRCHSCFSKCTWESWMEHRVTTEESDFAEEEHRNRSETSMRSLRCVIFAPSQTYPGRSIIKKWFIGDTRKFSPTSNETRGP